MPHFTKKDQKRFFVTSRQYHRVLRKKVVLLLVRAKSKGWIASYVEFSIRVNYLCKPRASSVGWHSSDTGTQAPAAGDCGAQRPAPSATAKARRPKPRRAQKGEDASGPPAAPTGQTVAVPKGKASPRPATPNPQTSSLLSPLITS